MKNLIFLSVVFLLFSFTIQKPIFQDLRNPKQLAIHQVNKDKEFLLAYFQQTSDSLQKSIEGLNEAQMRFKPTEDRWSVSQCIEHIILTEKMLFKMTKDLLEQPANPERKAEVKGTEQELIDGITDRSAKFKAPEMVQPAGKYAKSETALQDFNKQRDEILDFIKNTPEAAMRNHITDTPGGVADAYRSLLFIAGHTARHTLQIEEVKADAGFPAE